MSVASLFGKPDKHMEKCGHDLMSGKGLSQTPDDSSGKVAQMTPCDIILIQSKIKQNLFRLVHVNETVERIQFAFEVLVKPY